MRRAILWSVMILMSAAVGGGAPASAPATMPASRPAAGPDRPIDLEKVASKTILVIPIRGEIGSSTAYFVKRSIRRARDEKAGVILFDFDTPGGDMASMIEICQALGGLEGTPTIGFVNPLAGSAGAIILAGVNHIYMRSPSVVGSAALIAFDPQRGIIELPERVLEKYNSFIRAQVAGMAEKNGHPPALFQAMVDQKLEVREVFVDGERKFLTKKDRDNLQVRVNAGQVKEVREGELVVAEGELLALYDQDAERLGLSRGTVASREDLLERIGLADFTVTDSREIWSEHLARFLTHPVIVLVLMLVGAIGIYVELNTPGFGVPGMVGIGAFAILFLGQYVAGLAHILEPLLFLAGVGLLAIEIFVTPGFGFLGAGGILLMLVSVILAGQDFAVPVGEFQRGVFERNVTTVFGGFILSVVGMALMARYVPRTRVFNVLALRAPADAAALHGSAVAERAAVGDRGLATTPLRPAGRARFGDQYLDVVTEGQFLTSGSTIVVLRVDGNRIVVGPVRDSKEDTS